MRENIPLVQGDRQLDALSDARCGEMGAQPDQPRS
jgi:hypothetical protein